MTLRTQLSLALCSLFLACGPQSAAPASTTGGDASLTSNASSDAGDSPPAPDGGVDLADAGAADAGCPVYTLPGASGCVPEVTVQLTGTAVATRGDALVAGMGRQPELHAYVTLPETLSVSGVVFSVGLVGGESDGGSVMTTHTVPTTDDAGTHYDLPLTTSFLPEGTYSVVAVADVGAATFASNTVDVLVDRTPPTLQVSLSNDGGVVARDANLGVNAVADDGAGSGTASLTFTVTGRSILGPSDASVLFTPTLAIQGTTAAVNSPLALSQVPYDAWSTDSDGAAFTVVATATDAAGNEATSTLTVPAARRLWLNSGAQGQVGIGPLGQVLVNGGAKMSVVTPGGLSVAEVALGLGTYSALGIPATLLSTGSAYLLAQSVPGQPTASAFVSVGETGQAVTQPVPGATLSGLALDPAGTLYAVDLGCRPYSTSAALDVSPTIGGATDTSCANASAMLFDGALYEATAAQVQAYNFPSLTSLGYFQGAVPAIFSGSNTFAGLLGSAPARIGGGSAIVSALAMVSTSAGNVLSIDQNYVLRSETPAWSKQLGSGIYPGLSGGVVVGSGGLIYASDGNGTLSVFDEDGVLHWQSPSGMVLSTLMIDRCLSHAYAQSQGTIAIAVDSPGVDASPTSWPMSGHDVFQSYNGYSTDDIDCTGHW